MSDLVERLRFGDQVMNIAASEDNPIKYGVFIKTVVRRGRINAGRFVEYMTSDGRTHLTPPDNIVKVGMSAADEIERLRAQVEALTAAATTLLDQIRDSEMHGFGAFEQDCPECAAVKALSLALSSTNDQTLGVVGEPTAGENNAAAYGNSDREIQKRAMKLRTAAISPQQREEG